MLRVRCKYNLTTIDSISLRRCSIVYVFFDIRTKEHKFRIFVACTLQFPYFATNILFGTLENIALMYLCTSVLNTKKYVSKKWLKFLKNSCEIKILAIYLQCYTFILISLLKRGTRTLLR